MIAGPTDFSWHKQCNNSCRFKSVLPDPSWAVWICYMLATVWPKWEKTGSQGSCLCTVSKIRHEWMRLPDASPHFRQLPWVSHISRLVYAPWCGFSRKVLPVWKSFAQAVSQVGLAFIPWGSCCRAESSHVIQFLGCDLPWFPFRFVDRMVEHGEIIRNYPIFGARWSIWWWRRWMAIKIVRHCRRSSPGLPIHTFSLWRRCSLESFWRTYMCVCVCMCMYIYIYIWLYMYVIMINY